jgi:hypothetical protein
MLENSGPTLFLASDTEYDPIFPSNYMKILRSRAHFLRIAVEEAERQTLIIEEKKKIELIEQRRCEVEDRPFCLSSSSYLSAVNSQSAILKGNRGGLIAAQKMMEKIGWRPGTGLGKNKQGMTAALTVRKVDARTAVITTADTEDYRTGVGSVSDQCFRYKDPYTILHQRPTLLNKTCLDMGLPSSTLLLTNMVDSLEVDEFLEDETSEECTRYGQVQKVVAYVTTDRDSPVHKVVRIFVKFSNVHACTKALQDLNGRWFGGRMIEGHFCAI